MSRRTVAILPWGDLLEDFLDPLGLDLDAYASQMSGGWLFGYVEALAAVDVHTVVVCVSARVRRPEQRRHLPTGATIWVLPASRTYRLVRQRLADPYAWDRRGAAGDRSGPSRAVSSGSRHVAPYLSTPVRQLRELLRDERVDAVLCQEYEEARFDVVALLGSTLGLPVSATFQGGSAARTGMERLVRRRTLRLAHRLVVASGAEATRLTVERRVPPDRIARIPNPLDVDQWAPRDRARARDRLGLPRSARVAVWHGRVDVHRKGLDVLLDAWAIVAAGSSAGELLLLMVGTGSGAAALNQRLAARPVTGLQWIDRYTLDREELRCYLHAADVSVLSSRHEGFAVAPLEAMACGLPVVTADVPGISDLVPDGEADGGIVVPVADPPALAEALRALLMDLPRARRAGEAARARAVDGYAPARIGAELRVALGIDGPGE